MEERFDFADFYECHYRQALRYASMYVFNNEDARDIVSDVLLRFLEQKGKLNRERNIVGLFFSILKSATPFPKCYLHKEKWTFDS